MWNWLIGLDALQRAAISQLLHLTKVAGLPGIRLRSLLLKPRVEADTGHI